MVLGGSQEGRNAGSLCLHGSCLCVSLRRVPGGRPAVRDQAGYAPGGPSREESGPGTVLESPDSRAGQRSEADGRARVAEENPQKSAGRFFMGPEMPSGSSENAFQVPSPEEYATLLARVGRLTAPAIRAGIRGLQLPLGSTGMDVACGIGLHTAWLAEEVGLAGQVHGFDISSELLDEARNRIRSSSFRSIVEFRQGDVRHLPYEDASFDWIWCSDCLYPGPKEAGFASMDPIPLVREMARVLKPGGLLAVSFWTAHRLLPGHPLVEAQLNASPSAHYPFGPKLPPEMHLSRALAWLRAGGMTELHARSHVADIQGPLDDEQRDALTRVFHMLWDRSRPEVPEETWATYQSLCCPAEGPSILDLPDYHGFIVYAVLQGRTTD
jgi:SAM-dependent methyltransferase